MVLTSGEALIGLASTCSTPKQLRALEQFLAAVGRHHQHERRRAGVHGADAAHRLQPVHAGHLPVHQHKVKGLGLGVRLGYCLQRGRTRVDAVHHKAERAQQLAEQQRGGVVVIDHQHAPTMQVHAGVRDGRLAAAKSEPRGKPEGGALAVCSLHTHRTPHSQGQAFADGQPQAGATILARGRAVGLLKAFEESTHLIVGQANAGVAHGKVQQHVAGRGFLHADADAQLTFFCEFDGVVGVVDQYLADAQRVTHQVFGHLGINAAQQLQVFGLGFFTHEVDHVVDHRFQFERHRLNLQLAGLDFGEIQNVVDDA